MRGTPTHIMLVLCALSTLSACQSNLLPVQTPAPIPQGTETSDLVGQINVLATQTQLAAQASAASQPSGLPTSTQAHPPQTAAPTTDPLQRVGPFRQVALDEALIAGRVTGLLAPEDGSLILLSDKGYSRYTGEGWIGYFTDEAGHLVGMDPAGRAWVITRDGAQAAVWEGEQWKYYGLEAGWTPITVEDSEVHTSELAAGREGEFWLATGSDVRRFDGTAWQVFSPEIMGMPGVDSPELASTYVLSFILGTGEVLAGRCDWGTAGPEAGGGVRKFSEGVWQEVDPALSSGCVSAVHVQKDDTAWIGTVDSLFRLTPDGAVERIALPSPPQDARFGVADSLVTGPDGSAWVALSLCAAEGCFGEDILYRLQGGEWQQIGEPRPAGGQTLLFDAGGNPWLFSGGSVYKIADTGFQSVDGLVVLAAVKSPSSDIWMVAQSAGPPTLWKLETEP